MFWSNSLILDSSFDLQTTDLVKQLCGLLLVLVVALGDRRALDADLESQLNMFILFARSTLKMRRLDVSKSHP